MPRTPPTPGIPSRPRDSESFRRLSANAAARFRSMRARFSSAGAAAALPRHPLPAPRRVLLGFEGRGRCLVWRFRSAAASSCLHR